MKIAPVLAFAGEVFAPRRCLAGCLVAGMLATSAWAQSVPTTTDLPPPAIDDPGVAAPAPVTTPASASTARSVKPAPLTLPAMRSGDTRLGRPDDAIPNVTVHQQGENTVQEYSRNGRVYMVVVTPEHGVTQTYMIDPQGRVLDSHGQKPVTPVMYEVLKWGKSVPPAGSSEAPPSDSGN